MTRRCTRCNRRVVTQSVCAECRKQAARERRAMVRTMFGITETHMRPVLVVDIETERQQKAVEARETASLYTQRQADWKARNGV